MRAVNLKYAKAHLDRLIDEALAGEEVVIAEKGTPLVRLAPMPKPQERLFGLDQGKIFISDDFDEPMTDIEQAFYAAPNDPA